MGDLGQIFGAGFDTASVEPQADYEAIPPGKYPVVIENAEVMQTKAGTGHYIKLTMAVINGEYKNRKVWDRINIQNPSAQCVTIGLRCFAALGRALNISSITDSTQLINQVVIAHVKVKEDQNQVRTYSSAQQPVGMGVPQQQGVPVPQQQAAAVPPLAQQQAPAQLATPQSDSQAQPPWAR